MSLIKEIWDNSTKETTIFTIEEMILGGPEWEMKKAKRRQARQEKKFPPCADNNTQ